MFSPLLRRALSKPRISIPLGVLCALAILSFSPRSRYAPTDNSSVQHAPAQDALCLSSIDKTTHALFQCLALSNCGQNQTKVVIVESPHFTMLMENEWTGGEGIWAASMWDAARPTHRKAWRTQHDMLKHLSPPYVYHVLKNDRAAFVQAIKDALAHPIESYVLERMKMSAVEDRLGKLLEHDWRAEAAALLAERTASGEGRLFIL